MNLVQAVRKYKHRFPMVVSYQDYDRYIYINDDDIDLQKWRIEMPEPQDWKEITGFGMKPEDQVFEPEIYPSRLKLLESNIRKQTTKNRKAKETDVLLEKKIYETIWSTLENQSRDYRDEIDWIKSQWYYKNYGKWYFVNGKPIYVSKWQWFYLNYFNMENLGLPDFRYRDLKWFHAQEYAATTTLTVDYIITKKDGKEERTPKLLDDGTLKMKDVGSRTVFGTNNLKGRRVGETSKSQCINYCIAIDKIDSNNGIQGNTENTASDIYTEKLIYAYNRMAFFFVPETPNLSYKSELYFAGHHGKGGLNSRIVFATTAKKEFFDQKRLDFIHVDELGKTRLADVVERHGVLKRCCAAGDLIKGFMICTSTAEDMDSDVGILFEKLTMDSMFDQRLFNGQTKSGLINVYFPMYEAYEGFIDKFGYPISETPEKHQIAYMSHIEKDSDGDIMGAKAYIEKIEQDLLDSGDLNALAQFQRQHPGSFRKCFALASRGNNFNTQILQERIMYLKFSKENKVRRGRFVWTGEKFNSTVSFVDDENGNFNVSHQQLGGRASRTAFDSGVKIPEFSDGIVISADPYRFSQTDSSRESKGGIAAFRMVDYRVDGEKDDIKDWETNNFVATYCHREQDIDAFSEEVLKCAIYYNALVYAEANLSSIQEFFVRNGYYGYLLFDINEETGAKKSNSGFNTAGPSIKSKMFTLVDTFINLHGHKCNHVDILEEFLTIKNFDDTKNKDLFIAAAGCLLGAANRYPSVVKKFVSDEGVKVDGWW